DPAWQGGNYTAQPPGLRAALQVLFMMGSSAWQLQRSAPTRDSADATIQRWLAVRATTTDANDMLYQFDASRDYDPSPDLERITALMVGAFYNPHLGKELAAAVGIDHLAMADPPRGDDPWWPTIKAKYTLLLHDYLGQLSEPLDERAIQRARSLAELYHTPWVA